MSVIDIQQLHEFDGDGFGGAPVGFYAKGQHEPATFIKTLESEFDYTCETGDVKNSHFRKVPCEGGHKWINGKPGPGAFAATHVDHDCVRFVLDDCLSCGKPHSGAEPCQAGARATKEG